MAPFTKVEMMEEFREIVFQVARSNSFIFKPEAALNLLFNECFTETEESWNVYSPELTAESFGEQFDLKQIAAFKAVEQFYDYGLLGIRNTLPLEDGGANEWTFAYGLLWDASNSFLISDITNGEGISTTKCLQAARAFFARHILDGQKRTILPGDEHAPEDMLTIREVATLAGLDERTIRNATNRNAVNRLDTAIVDSNVYIPRESAQTWLRTKRGFTPSRLGDGLPKNVVLNGAFAGIAEACDYIQNTRNDMGLSQSDLLAVANLTHDTAWIQDIESGSSIATHEELKAIGNALGLNGELFALRINEAAYKTNMFALQGDIFKAMTSESVISEPEAMNHGQIEGIDMIENISKVFAQHGYKGDGKNLTKFLKFLSPKSESLYLLKHSSKDGKINVVVHNKFKRDHLVRLAGVSDVSAEHYFHSNMNDFGPGQQNGNCITTYGWKIAIDSIEDLKDFLNVFRTIKD